MNNLNQTIMIKFITKPFEKFQEKQLLIFGILILLLFSLIAPFTNTRFDGVLDMHNAHNVLLHQPLFDNIINTIILTLCLYGLAYFVNPKTRWIDIINIALICRLPFYPEVIFNINDISLITGEHLLKNITNPIAIFDLPILNLIVFFALSLYGIFALILFGFLIYNGFITATNVKKTSHKLLLIPVVIIAEIISQFFVYLY